MNHQWTVQLLLPIRLGEREKGDKRLLIHGGVCKDGQKLQVSGCFLSPYLSENSGTEQATTKMDLGASYVVYTQLLNYYA